MKALKNLFIFLFLFVFIFSCAAVWHGANVLYEKVYPSNPSIYERCLALEIAMTRYELSDGTGMRNIMDSIRKDGIEIDPISLANYSRQYNIPDDDSRFGNPFFSAVKLHNSASCMRLHKQPSIDMSIYSLNYYLGYFFW